MTFRETRAGPLALVMAIILICEPAGAAMSDEAWDEQLAQVRHFNTIGQVAQARQLLVQLTPALAQAGPDQAFEYALLDAHNLALGGELEQGALALEPLLATTTDRTRRFRALTLAANLAAAGRQHEKAFTHLRDALALRQHIDHPEYLSQMLSNAAQMLAAAGETERAIALGQEAVQAAQASGIAREQCVSGQRLAYAKEKNGQLDAAAEAILAALAFCRAAGDRVFSATLAMQKAALLTSRGENGAALHYLDRAERLFEQADYDRGLAIARVRRAILLAGTGQIDAATDLARGQIAILTQAGLWDYVSEAHGLLAQSAGDGGDYVLSLDHLNQRIETERRQLERERARRLAYLQIAFELDQREAEVEQLRNQALSDALLAQASQQRSRLQIFGYLAAALLIVILILLVWQASREGQHYRRLARRDGLTGLYNHTRFFENTDALLKRSARRGIPLTLVLADIDHFKQINDEHGHLAGDTVLERVGARLRAGFPPPSVCGRIGGEEFGMVLPGTGMDEALRRVESLREEINRKRESDHPADIRMSFGLAEQRPGDSLASFRQRADDALYQAKRQGRDRAVCATC
ncbi:MAG: GGDEF domain-containing protein [Wenzhouxiangella sp.]|nr:MAG: GGDEF domain-containing protein [Wenzhouxiangella sp.]